MTILDLEVGQHTLVLKSSAGSITRRFTIKNNTTTILSESIFSGWLRDLLADSDHGDHRRRAGQPHR